MLSMELKASNELSEELYDWAEQGTNPTAHTNIAARITRVIDVTARERFVLLMQPYTQ
jgi:hypothetical protein